MMHDHEQVRRSKSGGGAAPSGNGSNPALPRGTSRHVQGRDHARDLARSGGEPPLSSVYGSGGAHCRI